jgi:hypothetical protein
MGLLGPMISPPITPAAIGLANESTNSIGAASVGTKDLPFEVLRITESPKYTGRWRLGCVEKWRNRAQESFNEVPNGCRFTGLCTLRIFKYPQACICTPGWVKYRPRY